MGMAKQVIKLSNTSLLNTAVERDIAGIADQEQTSFGRVSVIGLGYVGLPTATLLASMGSEVIGVDINTGIVDCINEGRPHISEQDLDEKIRLAVTGGNLRAVTKPETADVYIIAVPTPLTEDKKPDLFAVKSAFASLVPVIAKGNLIILESTSPVGTTEMMCRFLERARPDLSFPTNSPETADVSVAYCPERILPGNTLYELKSNSRIAGGIDRKSGELARSFYGQFCKGDISILSVREAEAAKLIENAYRDVNIAFANEVSMYCEEMQINPFRVIRAANNHPRVNILSPGPGVGGHCIPVDPWFLIDACPEKAKLMTVARQTNDLKIQHSYNKVREAVTRFDNPRIAFLGITYKPDVDDIRESPALEIVKMCRDNRLGELLVVEPNLEKLPSSLHDSENVHMTDFEIAIQVADIVVLLVKHREFEPAARHVFENKTIIDIVGILEDREEAL